MYLMVCSNSQTDAENAQNVVDGIAGDEKVFFNIRYVYVKHYV